MSTAVASEEECHNSPSRVWPEEMVRRRGECRRPATGLVFPPRAEYPPSAARVPRFVRPYSAIGGERSSYISSVGQKGQQRSTQQKCRSQARGSPPLL